MKLIAYFFILLSFHLAWAENEEFLINHYTIQVFSSRDKAESKEFAQKFHSISQPYIWPVKINQDQWFRVYVGLYSSKQDASEKLEKVKKDLNIHDAFIRKVIDVE